MKSLFRILPIVSLLILTASCSVISSRLREQALPEMPFPELLQNAEQYRGRTVILGGYIIETQNQPDQTVIKVLQTPLTFGEEPGEKDDSQGRFLVVHEGFLDPEVYKKDRIVTVAGTILGLESEDIGMCPYACLKIKSLQIHLWPEYDYRYPYYSPYYYDYPYNYYPSRRYNPYWRDDPFFWPRYYP
jgi:outer membrane lipoprotein